MTQRRLFSSAFLIKILLLVFSSKPQFLIASQREKEIYKPGIVLDK